MAISASVCGTKPEPTAKRRQPAQAPGPPRQFRDRVAQVRQIAALQPVGQDDDRGAAGVAAERGTARKAAARRRCGCRRPNRSPERGGRERLLAALEPQRARQARQARAKGEDFDIRASPVPAYARA